jgi:hypothetical protein
MKFMRIGSLAIAALALVPGTATAKHRVGNAALGAIAGGVVFGPVGAIAGAAVGYTAGEGIARDWGVRRARPRHRVKHR